MRASEPAANAASATNDSRYRGHPLAGALAFRRSVAALARLLPLAQLRAALTGVLRQLAPPQTPFTSELLAPRSLCRRGRVRSRPGAMCETARRRRSPLHPADRLARAPLGERACVSL